MTKTHLLLVGGALLGAATQAPAAVSPLTVATLSNPNYAQDFNTLANSGVSDQLPTGWQISESGTSNAADGQYAAGTGSSNAGNAYSFGSAGSTDRALGAVTSGSASPISLGAIFTNGLAAAITEITIAYTGEQWRLANAVGSTLSFQYALGATDVSDTGGSWINFTPLNFASVQTGGASAGTALDGNAAANRAAISGTITGLSIAQNTTFGIRWRDLDVTGSDNGLAIDDLALTASTAAASAVPEPASWAMMVAGFGLLGGALRRRPSVIRYA